MQSYLRRLLLPDTVLAAVGLDPPQRDPMFDADADVDLERADDMPASQADAGDPDMIGT